MRSPWLTFALVALTVVGCGRRRGGGDDDADGDADADSDSDGDSDGDADPPECTLGCPAGYTCELGICGGGDPASLTLDIGSVPVSGNVTVDGARPATGPDCASCPDCGKANVNFVSEDGGSFTTAILCSSSAYAFDLDLAPGTYAVSVYGYGAEFADLPPGTAPVVRALRVP
jgi:hypothetical protein